MYAIIKNIENNTKKTQFELLEKVKVFKNETRFPLAYEICFGNLKGQTYLIKDENAYLIDDWFVSEFSVESKRRNLFEYRIDTVISNSLLESRYQI